MQQELGAVRHLDRLDQNLAGLGEGGMHRQLRTAAAEAALRKALRAGPAEAVAGMSTSSMKKGMPALPGRCSMVSRFAACSKETPKRERSTSMS